MIGGVVLVIMGWVGVLTAGAAGGRLAHYCFFLTVGVWCVGCNVVEISMI
jgi:hypothetical protein